MVPFFVTRHPEIEYTGVVEPLGSEASFWTEDVVSEVIERNQQRHPLLNFLAQEHFKERMKEKDAKRRDLFRKDLAEIPLPYAELIFSKETVNHMHLDDAQRALRQFAATGAKYLLTNVRFKTSPSRST